MNEQSSNPESVQENKKQKQLELLFKGAKAYFDAFAKVNSDLSEEELDKELGSHSTITNNRGETMLGMYCSSNDVDTIKKGEFSAYCYFELKMEGESVSSHNGTIKVEEIRPENVENGFDMEAWVMKFIEKCTSLWGEKVANDVADGIEREMNKSEAMEKVLNLPAEHQALFKEIFKRTELQQAKAEQEEVGRLKGKNEVLEKVLGKFLDLKTAEFN